MSKIILILYVLTASLALVTLKLGTNTGLPISYINSKVQFNVNAYTIVGFLLYGLSFLTYIYLIAKNDLGYIIPLAAAFVYILIFIASYLIFKEVFTATKIMGIVLILGGIVLLNLNK